MQRRHLVIALGIVPVLLVGIGSGQRAVFAEVNRSEYIIRYAVFTAKPKGVNPYRNGELSPVFQRLQDGSELELGASPEGFMAALRKDEPKYHFTLLLSGSQRGTAGSPITINAGPVSQDPRQMKLKDEFILTPKSGSIVGVAREGSLSYIYPNGSGKMAFGWSGRPTQPIELVLQRTYSSGICTLEDPEQPLVYVFSILRADR